MKIHAVVLAAGYARRMFPHLRNVAKPLLPIAGKPMIELLVERLCSLEGLSGITIVTNALYVNDFEDWLNAYAHALPDTAIVSDGTRSHRDQLGPMRDLLLAIKRQHLTGPLLVVAGDNLIDFNLQLLLDVSDPGHTGQPTDVAIGLVDMKDRDLVKGRFGVVTLDGNRIIGFEEKPQDPVSTIAATLCYIFPPYVHDLLSNYVPKAATLPADAGQFIEYLCSETDAVVRGQVFAREDWCDIGTPTDYCAFNQTHLLKKLKNDPKFRTTIDAVILFADLIGSSSVSEYSSDREYDNYITEFQELALSTYEACLDRYNYTSEDRNFCEFQVRGDEAVFIAYTKDLQRDASAATAIAMDLKRGCFLSRYNRKRKGRAFYDVGIGIHYGRVSLGQHPTVPVSKSGFNAIGYAINLTKRIEGSSREGRFSRIMLSEAFTNITAGRWDLAEPQYVPLKGIYGEVPIHEIQYFGGLEDPEDEVRISAAQIRYYEEALQHSPYDLWLLMQVARYYYDAEEYEFAEKLYEEAVSRNSDFSVGYIFLGRCRYRQNKYREAERAFKKAQLQKELSARNYHYLANTLRRLGRFEEAIEAHEQAATLDNEGNQESPFVYNAFAYTIAEGFDQTRDRYSLDDAEKYLKKSIGLMGADAQENAYLWRHTEGMIYMQRGASAGEDDLQEIEHQLDLAQKAFEDVIEDIKKDEKMMRLKSEEKTCEAKYHLAYVHLFRHNRNLEETATGERKIAQGLFDECVETPHATRSGRANYYWFSDAKQKSKELQGRVPTTYNPHAGD